jgi:hypothetical protein
MKKSELKRLIKEELLKEIGSSTYKQMDSLVTIKDITAFKKLAKSLYAELYDEGWEQDDIMKFFDKVLVDNV